MPDSLTFQALFDSIQLSSIGDSGHAVMLKASVKGAKLDAKVSWSVSFGLCYVWFDLPMASSSEPVAKHLCHSSAFDGLLANMARHDELRGKPNYFFQKRFIPTNQPELF